MYSSFDIAKRIINWCNGNSIPITNLKLQKLLYFAQGEFFKNQKARLINEDFYAWELGPVIPRVYSLYAMFSSTSIPKQTESESFTEEVLNQIEETLMKYARISTWDLVEISHNQDPWKYTHQVFGNKAIIPYESIAEYFGGVNS